MEGTGSAITLATLLTQIGTILSTCMTWITNNEFLAIMFGASVISVGFYAIRKAKKTAKA